MRYVWLDYDYESNWCVAHGIQIAYKNKYIVLYLQNVV